MLFSTIRSAVRGLMGVAIFAGLFPGGFAMADVLMERSPRFAYDQNAGFGVTENGVEARGSIVVRDITFVAVPGSADALVKAYLVAPEGSAPCAGILWVHWLGEPATTNRTQFLDEAVALAQRGVVSVLIDAMWSQPEWYRNRVLGEDYANSVKQVIAIRRGLDLLRVQPRVDAARISFVAHDYGAMYGTIAVALDQRVKTCVLIAATPSLNDWAFFVQKPASMDDYLKQNRVLELRDFLSATRGVSTLMQFAGRDEYVPIEKADSFFAAANEPKQKLLYAEAGHDMHAPAAIREDRTAFLVRELGLKQ